MTFRRVAIASILILGACSTGSEPSAERAAPSASTQGQADATTQTRESPPAITAATIDVEPTDVPPVISLDPLLSATDAKGVVVDEIRIDVIDDDQLDIPTAFSLAGPAVNVTAPDGLVTEPVTLRLDGERPPAGAVPVVLHRNELGRWEALPASYTDGRYVVEALSFSPFVPGWAAAGVDWAATTAGSAKDALGNVFDTGVDWVTGRTDEPNDCRQDRPQQLEPPGWAVSTGSPSDGAFHACLISNPTVDGTERVEMKIKSNRSVAMWVVVPLNGYDNLWVEGSAWDHLGPILTFLTPGATDRVLLAPGRTLTVGYQRPVGESPQLEFYAYQDFVTQFASLALRHLGDVEGYIATLLAAIGCFDTDALGGLATWDRAASCFSAGLGLTANQIDLAIDNVGDRWSSGTPDAAKNYLREAGRLDKTLQSVQKIGLTIAVARFTTDVWVLVNDSATGLAIEAGRTYANLIPTARSSDDQTTCVVDELSPFTEGRTDEIRLYQETLTALGYDPGQIDGRFGDSTLDAAYEEIQQNGTPFDDEGNFVEWFPDDGAVLRPAFERLGIACPSPDLATPSSTLTPSGCIGADEALRLAQPVFDGLTVADTITCIGQVAVGNLFFDSGDGVTVAYATNGQSWSFLAGSFGLRSVCEAVWGVDPTIDIGCGGNFMWPYSDYFSVPQLGTEPVRGSGCGGSGTLGDDLPDGLWNGLVLSLDAATVDFDLACVYFGQSAQPLIDEYLATTPEDDRLDYNPDYWVINNTVRGRSIPLADDFVYRSAEWSDGGSCNDPGPSADIYAPTPTGVIDSWLRIENGVAQWLLTSCFYG